MVNVRLYEKLTDRYREHIGWIRYIPAMRRINKAVIACTEQNSDCDLFYALAGIGDTCYMLCYLDELKKISGKKTVVLTRGNLETLVRSYSGVDDIILISEKELAAMRAIASHSEPDAAEEKENGNGYNWDVWKIVSGIKGADSALNCVEAMRVYQYHLAENAPVTYPDEALAARYTTIKDFDIYRNAVILNPYSYSLFIDGIIEIFEQLAQKLREEGYAVYTNVVGKQECIRGTLPLRCSICDFYFVTQISACVIGVRSGILDFTVNNGASYLVFYDNSRNGLYLKNYTLTGWKTDSRICEMLVPPEHGPDFFAEIYRNIQLLIGR